MPITPCRRRHLPFNQPPKLSAILRPKFHHSPNFEHISKHFIISTLSPCTGRKRKKSKTSNYIISCDPTDLSRQADGFVGKLRSNVFGTTFFVYDSGSKSSTQDYYRQDMAVVIYVRENRNKYKWECRTADLPPSNSSIESK